MKKKKFLKTLVISLGVLLLVNISYLIGYFRYLVKKQNEMILVLSNDREAPAESELPGNITILEKKLSKRSNAS